MKRYLGVDLHRNCFTVHTRQEDGSGESREWSIRSLKAFAKTVTANDAVVLRGAEGVRVPDRGGEPAPVSGDQPIGEKDR